MEGFFIVPRETYGPFILWVVVTFGQLPWLVYCLSKIEKTGLKRLGACGSMFKVNEKD
jgi:hypothetical protein